MKPSSESESETRRDDPIFSMPTSLTQFSSPVYFSPHSKKDFAKRLLLNKSASSDAEKSMLLKLREGGCDWLFSVVTEFASHLTQLSCTIHPVRVWPGLHGKARDHGEGHRSSEWLPSGLFVRRTTV